MNYRSLVIDRVFFARLSSPPSIPDLESLLEELRVQSQRAGKKLFLVFYVNKDAETLKPEVRERIQKLTPALLEHCEGVYSIIDGTGVLRNLARIIVRGIIVAGGYHGKLFVCDSADDAFASFAKHLDMEPDHLLSQAKAEGLLP